MERTTETDALIAELAGGSGDNPRQGRTRRRARLSLDGGLLVNGIGGFLIAVCLPRALFPAPRGVIATLLHPAFDFKFLAMAALAIGGGAAVRQCSRPGLLVRHWLWFVPGIVLLGTAAALDPSGYPALGRTAFSVPACTFAITGLSLVPLGAMLTALSRGVVTRLLLTGTAAGLLAGTIGAAAYAFVCQNDGAVFVALWYGAAILISALLGAIAGQRYLRW